MGAKLGSEQDRVRGDPTDEELMELINKEYPIEKAQYVFEAGTKIFNLSLDEFIEIFYARNSLQSYTRSSSSRTSKLKRASRREKAMRHLLSHASFPLQGCLSVDRLD